MKCSSSAKSRMDVNMQLTIKSFRPLFPDNSLTFSKIKSLTFPGFPHKQSPCLHRSSSRLHQIMEIYIQHTIHNLHVSATNYSLTTLHKLSIPPKIALNLTHEFCSIFIQNTVKQGQSVTHMVRPDKIQHNHPLP